MGKWLVSEGGLELAIDTPPVEAARWAARSSSDQPFQPNSRARSVFNDERDRAMIRPPRSASCQQMSGSAIQSHGQTTDKRSWPAPRRFEVLAMTCGFTWWAILGLNQ